MWRLAQNSDNIKPAKVDDISSAKYVYVRKDFTEVEIEDQEGKTHTVWQYYENKILKQDWELYESIIANQNDVTDIQEAICDLYEMIGG